MSTARRIILLEFNELTPHLMERFVDMGCLPHFKRLRDESQVYTTEAAERGWELNPWVQWVTVHSGLDYCDHQIIELDEGDRLRAERVWDVVSAAGRPVWVCGSMNVGYQASPKGAIMPDPWTTKVAPWPDALKPFFRFVQQSVLEHTSDHLALSRAEYARFLAFMATHGMTAATFAAIARQLASERFGGSRWRRAVLLDRLQFDVFRWYYRRLQPAFSTFFSNSTAHFQHFHWREMEPHLFRVQPSAEKLAEHERTILFGYQQMDALVGRFLRLAGRDATLIFATAISQQPCLAYEDQGGKMMYRPTDVSRLMQFAGVTQPYTAAPVMAEVFILRFASDADAAAAETTLAALRVRSRPAMQLLRNGAEINAKCQIHDPLDANTTLSRGCAQAGEDETPFFKMFYALEESKSGMHHPDGMLWIRVPGASPSRHTNKVPLASLAPTILQLLSLPRPAHMKAAPLAV